MTSLDLDIAVDALLEERAGAHAELVRMICQETTLSQGNAVCIASQIARIAQHGVRVPLVVIESSFVLEILRAYEEAAVMIEMAHTRWLS